MSNSIQFRRSTAILTLLAASIGGGLVAALAVATHSGSPVYVTAKADTSSAKVSALSSSFADVIEKATPSVVHIESTQIIKASQQNGENPFMADPFFRQFFGGNGQGQGMQKPRDQRESGLGSGVIVSPDGYILTNNHVVAKATTVMVTLRDKREFKAKVIGTDPQTDVAVIKINAGDLPALPLGNSDASRPGDIVFAIGNPFGFDDTVTMGIISAKGRSLEAGGHLQDFIQTDASINPGNSGGALINSHGDMVAMNTAIIAGNSGMGGEGGNVGIGFAVPVNMARQVMDQLIKNGKVSRGYIGVTLEPLNSALAQQFGAPNTNGAVVTDVAPGQPGAKAGLQSGDVITAIDGSKVQDSTDLTMKVTEHAPGQSVTLDVLRNGKPMKVNVTLGLRPTEVDFAQRGGKNPEQNNGPDNGDNNKSTSYGISVQAITPEIAQQVGVPAGTHGVVVTEIEPDSPAADPTKGIGQGSVITAVNRQPVNNIQDFKRLMGEANGKPVLLTVNNGGSITFTVVESK
ncbi:MAG TPA: Do family serine endopeptidase [Bryobacteraceae bacterium]|jgi:Do/DeqQ family serine protease|nr:Do family serine endopeptidase [Bryobacteraceae bacterium]